MSVAATLPPFTFNSIFPNIINLHYLLLKGNFSIYGELCHLCELLEEMGNFYKYGELCQWHELEEMEKYGNNG